MAGVAGVSAQTPIRGAGPDGSVQLIGNDAAWLDTASDNKRDLPCTVTPVKPILGFDLRFHSGYDIAMPLVREVVQGDGDLLTIIFRVTSAADKNSPKYFSHKYNVPRLEEDAKGDANLGGGFDIGEGDYHVDWLMRDRIERVCFFQLGDITAALQPRDQGMKLPIVPHTIEASSTDFLRKNRRSTRAKPEESFRVKILVNYAPQQGYAASMQPLDTVALMSILRHIQREPRRFRRFSLVAFNMNEQRVVYRQEDADHIDFPALGKALSSLKFGMVDVKKLNDPHSGSEFPGQTCDDRAGWQQVRTPLFSPAPKSHSTTTCRKGQPRENWPACPTPCFI